MEGTVLTDSRSPEAFQTLNPSNLWIFSVLQVDKKKEKNNYHYEKSFFSILFIRNSVS